MEPDTVWGSLCLQKHAGFISPHHITQQLESPFPRGKRAVKRSPDFQGQICKACLDASGSSEAWWCTPQTPGSHSQALTCSTHFTDREMRPEPLRHHSAPPFSQRPHIHRTPGGYLVPDVVTSQYH